MKNKIGIVLPFQNGDLITATSCLRYRKELWGDADIVWFCNETHSDALKFQDVEIRNFPHGWGILGSDIIGQYAERIKKDKEDGKPEWEDWSILINSENRLSQELKYKFAAICDLHDAYFPAPWMLTPQQRHGLEYPLISKKVFGVPMDWEWHPVLMFSDEERIYVNKFIASIPKSKNIAIETFAGSGQSILSHEQIIRTMEICQDVLGQCNFIFVSHKYLKGNENFPASFFVSNKYFAMSRTVRQCALLVEKCDLLVSVSSGISVASSAWGLNPTPIIQFTGSAICSTQALALGRFELITHDDKSVRLVLEEYYLKLHQILNEIK